MITWMFSIIALISYYTALIFRVSVKNRCQVPSSLCTNKCSDVSCYNDINFLKQYFDFFEQYSFLKDLSYVHVLIAFAFVLIFSTFTESLGLHFIVGAFFAAMLLSDNLIGHDNMKTIEKTTSNMAMGFLAPIFFAGIGLEFNFSSIENIGLLIAVIVVSYGSKVIGGYLGGVFAGLSQRTSWTLGIGLNARGIMELVIANIAYKNELISTEVFSILVIMGVLTTLTTPLMLKKAFGKTS
jgi:Kef-type K+ transport system membrane component KefB